MLTIVTTNTLNRELNSPNFTLEGEQQKAS